VGIAQAEQDAAAQEGMGSLIGKVGGSLLGPLGTAAGEKLSTSLG
jgi:hypothetical protein